MLTLMSTLRTLFITDPMRPYFLSAAPQCPRPDASIPLTAMQTQTDFVFVQFYNNPSCDLDTGSAFLASLTAWSGDLDGVLQMDVAGVGVGGFQDVGNGVEAPKVFVERRHLRRGGVGLSRVGSSGGFWRKSGGWGWRISEGLCSGSEYMPSFPDACDCLGLMSIVVCMRWRVQGWMGWARAMRGW
jgi:hypothetical protein